MSNPIDHLKKLAKGLLKQAQAADPQACARARHIYSDYREAPDVAVGQHITLGRAQHMIAVEHGFQSWEGIASATPIALYLAITMAKVPRLNDFGIGLFQSDRTLSREKRAAILHADRRLLIASVERVRHVVDWLKENVAPTKTLNRRRTSYGIKHIAERDIGYITNGVFIAAGIIAGYPYEISTDSPNVPFGMSERSLKRVIQDREANDRPYGWRMREWIRPADDVRLLKQQIRQQAADPDA